MLVRQFHHLTAEHQQTTVLGIKLIDKQFDLGVVEMDRLDAASQFFAQLLILALIGGRKGGVGAKRGQPSFL